MNAMSKLWMQMAMEGLKYMAEHFLPRKLLWTWYGRTWSMLRCDQEVRYRTDYILCMDHCMFNNVALRDPRHNTEH